jgi:hypothetical protein
MRKIKIHRIKRNTRKHKRIIHRKPAAAKKHLAPIKIKFNPRKANTTKGVIAMVEKHRKSHRHNPGNPCKTIGGYTATRPMLGQVTVPSYDRFIKKGKKVKHNPPSIFRNPLAAIKGSVVHPFNMDGLKEAVALTAGAVGSTWLPKLILGKRYTGIISYVSNIATATVLASATKMIFKKDELARAVLHGGITATVIRALIGPVTPQATGVQAKLNAGFAMSGLNTAQLDKIKKQIEAEVSSSMGGLPYLSKGVSGLPYMSRGASGLPYQSRGIAGFPIYDEGSDDE